MYTPSSGTQARFTHAFGTQARITHAFDNALCLPLNERSRYILLGDCHRGTGSANDNFLKNEFLYTAALNHYFHSGFTYLELGDGDELWENRSFSKIKELHTDSFRMISRFYQAGRLHMLYGNHDIEKKKLKFPTKHFGSYYCEYQMQERPLCPGIQFYEGIILKDERRKKDIYITHGHQTSTLNSTLWPLARFLVRYVWRPLEALGVPDPTSAAKNNTQKRNSEKTLTRWAVQNQHLLITGHTHHPMIGTPDSPYFNAGSCVHPTGITGIEIENRRLTLVKWSVKSREDLNLYAAREVLGSPVCIDKC